MTEFIMTITKKKWTPDRVRGDGTGEAGVTVRVGEGDGAGEAGVTVRVRQV